MIQIHRECSEMVGPFESLCTELGFLPLVSPAETSAAFTAYVTSVEGLCFLDVSLHIGVHSTPTLLPSSRMVLVILTSRMQRRGAI